MAAFAVGDRVVLPANVDEGWDEEEGIVEAVEAGYPGMYLVRLFPAYRGRGDDGVREVHEDGLRATG